MKKKWHKPTVVLVLGAAVGAHQLAEYAIASYYGGAQAPGLSDMTTTAGNVAVYDTGAMVFSAATIIEPKPPKNLAAPRVQVTWVIKTPKG